MIWFYHGFAYIKFMVARAPLVMIKKVTHFLWKRIYITSCGYNTMLIHSQLEDKFKILLEISQKQMVMLGMWKLLHNKHFTCMTKTFICQ